MIDLPPTAPPSPSPLVPAAPAGGAVSSAAGFAQALGAILDDRADPPAPPLAATDDRQAVAEDGNDLPADPDDATDPGPVAAWIAALSHPLPPPPLAGKPVATGRGDRPFGPISAAAPTIAAIAPDVPPPEAVAIGEPVKDPASSRLPAYRPNTPATEPPVAPRPDPVPIAVSAIPRPAHQLFAAALATASGWRERATESDPVAPPAILVEIVERPAVHAAGATHDAPFDLGTERGLQQTIDRIVQLRDAAGDENDARDTRIRLVPDRLGAVDIAVRREGDAVRVHFTAERETTQTLLADAQPRLAELAAQRGVRIAEASVSTGTPPQHQHQHQQQHHAAQPSATRAPVPADPSETPEETRLA